MPLQRPREATKEQFQEMLQNLLVERFHLVFHHEMLNFPGYALVVDKGVIGPWIYFPFCWPP
jgi:uncharacterized protein (TIGR03435 family)